MPRQGVAELITGDDFGKVADVECYTREGWLLYIVPERYSRTESKKLICSKNSLPYRITTEGLFAVRPRVINPLIMDMTLVSVVPCAGTTAKM